MRGAPDRIAIAQRLVPAEFALVAILPSPSCNRFDRLRRDTSLVANFEQRFDIARIASGNELTSIAHGLALIGQSPDLPDWIAADDDPE